MWGNKRLMYSLGRGYCLAGLIPVVVGAAGEQRKEQGVRISFSQSGFAHSNGRKKRAYQMESITLCVVDVYLSVSQVNTVSSSPLYWVCFGIICQKRTEHSDLLSLLSCAQSNVVISLGAASA